MNKSTGCRISSLRLPYNSILILSMLCIPFQTYASDLILDNTDPGTYKVIESASTGSQPSLEAIKSANGNINEIRLLLKGNENECYKLLIDAIIQDDAVSQIQLSYALFGMRWGDDKNRDFSSAVASDLEDNFLYYPREFYLFNAAYDDALGLETDWSDWRERDKRAAETFKKASALGYLPAVIELLYIEWKWKTNSLGFALVFQPYVGKGDKYLDYDFGKALKNNSSIGSELYYEGMYWMEISLGIDVKYPRENESFEEFIRLYYTHQDVMSTYYVYDGLFHLSSGVILAPSKQFWLDFKAEKLQNINPTVGQGLSIL